MYELEYMMIADVHDLVDIEITETRGILIYAIVHSCMIS